MVAAVALGGAAGAAIRSAGLAVFHTAPGGFPRATLVGNVTGAFLLGLLMTVLVRRWSRSRYTGPLLGTGLLGAFPSVSAFAVELSVLLRAGAWPVAGWYAGATMVLGLGAAGLGVIAGRWSTTGRGHGAGHCP